MACYSGTFQKVSFQFPVSAVYDFKGHFRILFKNHLPCQSQKHIVVTLSIIIMRHCHILVDIQYHLNIFISHSTIFAAEKLHKAKGPQKII